MQQWNCTAELGSGRKEDLADHALGLPTFPLEKSVCGGHAALDQELIADGTSGLRCAPASSA